MSSRASASSIFKVRAPSKLSFFCDVWGPESASKTGFAQDGLKLASRAPWGRLGRAKGENGSHQGPPRSPPGSPRGSKIGSKSKSFSQCPEVGSKTSPQGRPGDHFGSPGDHFCSIIRTRPCDHWTKAQGPDAGSQARVTCRLPSPECGRAGHFLLHVAAQAPISPLCGHAGRYPRTPV